MTAAQTDPFKRYHTEPITSSLFQDLCHAHDLTYMYSDDRRVYNKGHDQLNIIQAAATKLGMDKAVPIWNKVVSDWLVPDAAEAFKWKMPG